MNSNINHLRLKSSCYNLSNLYDLSISLSPYIKNLDLDSLNLQNGEIKFFSGTSNLTICKPNNSTTYYLQDPLVDKVNILTSSNTSINIDLKNNDKCKTSII